MGPAKMKKRATALRLGTRHLSCSFQPWIGDHSGSGFDTELTSKAATMTCGSSQDVNSRLECHHLDAGLGSFLDANCGAQKWE